MGFGDLNKHDLDNYITGHYGEDQFKGEPDDSIEVPDYDDEETFLAEATRLWKEKHAQWTVAVFVVDRAYGGHEEGGWWFDVGAPAKEYQHLTKCFGTDKDKALAYRDELDATVCKDLNDGKPGIESVICEGVYRAIIDNGEPKAFPERRPHYE